MTRGAPIEPRRRLVLFDCDGTLVDSEGGIVTAMAEGFRAHGLVPPAAGLVREVVGLPLETAVALLLPETARHLEPQVTQRFRAAFAAQRARGALEEPLFPGMRAVVDQLAAAGFVLGVATGKSRRGLIGTLTRHGILPLFTTLWTADDGPGKPDPWMALQALAETGIAAADAVMIGDTVWDLRMAQGAGLRTIAVGWGYHSAGALAAAAPDRLVQTPEALIEAIHSLFEDAP